MGRLSNFSPRTDDERIHDDVCRQLMSEADIELGEIVVGVKNSTVVLTGRVGSCLERREAESVALAAYGVSSIINNILVEPKRPKTDREIRDTILASLRTSMCVLEDLPSVSVCDGIVTLGGQARWKFQAVSAERAAEAVVGVHCVRNLIEVVTFETHRPRQRMNRNRLNDTPSSMNCAEPKPDFGCRPLFVVPSVIARI